MMEQETDLAIIDDLMTLKALAYDQLAVIEQAQRNLGAINQRISQLATTNGAAPQ
jgi:hypothetical protein